MTPERIAALHLALQANLPVLLWGQPGVGKTATVRALGRKLDWEVTTVIASLYEPTDFSGLPVPDGAGDVRRAMPAWAKRLASAGAAILFLDEITTAPPAVQAVLFRVVLERALAEQPLDPEVRIVAAANPPETAGGYDLLPPLANRFIHLDWPADVAAFRAGLRQDFALPPLPNLPASWEERLPVQIARIDAFLAARPQLGHALPKDPAQQGRAWPSFRSWREYGARVLAASEAAEAGPEARALLLEGAIGVAALEYLTWEREADLPDPEVVLAHPDRFVLPQRSDVAYAVLASVVAATRARPEPKRLQACWRVLHAAFKAGGPDVAITAAADLAQLYVDGTLPLPPDEIVSDIWPFVEKVTRGRGGRS